MISKAEDYAVYTLKFDQRKHLPLVTSSSSLFAFPAGAVGVGSGRHTRSVNRGGIDQLGRVNNTFSGDHAVVESGHGGSRGGGSLVQLGLLFFFALLEFFDITVEEEIDGDFPRLGPADGSTESEDFAGQEPVQETNGEFTLVVGGDGDIDVLQGGVGVAEGNDGDVDVRSFLDGLAIGAGVGDDQKAGFLELLGDLVSESSGSESSSDGLSTSVVGCKWRNRREGVLEVCCR